MIVPMKKVTMFVSPKQTEESTRALKKLGLLHPELTYTGSRDLDQLSEELTKTERAISLIPKVPGEQAKLPMGSDEVYSLLDRVLKSGDEIKNLSDQNEVLDRELIRVGPWGNFQPSLVKDLQARGFALSFAQLTRAQVRELPDTAQYIVLETIKNSQKILFITKPLEEIPGEVFDLPHLSLEEMKRQKDLNREQIQSIQEHLAGMQAERVVLENHGQKLRDRIEFQQVKESLTDHGVASVITGFMPAEAVDELKTLAKEEGWAILLQDPAPEDQVPTLTKNPKIVCIIQPVFDLLGTVPGYREKDISLWFLMFFIIFFAMIIGDGGYGVILLGFTLFFAGKKKKATGSVPDGLILMGVLSSATVIWGAITGNWFGWEPFSQLPILRSLVIPGLFSFDPRTVEAVQFICFVIGTVHLVLAHTLQFMAKLKENPPVQAFGQLGWLITVLGLYYLVLNVVISSTQFPVPDFALWMIGGGMLMVFLFENQQDDGFMNGILRSLGNLIPTALSGVSAFSDIISYIRLFAVGLASIEIAKSFNGMAEGIIESGALGIPLGIFVVIFGHTLNLAMAGLSVVVHGVRLNMLEFSNHVGNEWAGFAYKPFGNRVR